MDFELHRSVLCRATALAAMLEEATNIKEAEEATYYKNRINCQLDKAVHDSGRLIYSINTIINSLSSP